MYIFVCVCMWLQQTKAKYEIEAEKRELARLLEKRTQEVENLSGKISESHTQKESKDTKLETLYINTACNVSINTCFPLWVSRLVFSSHFYLCSPISQIFLKGFYSLCSVPPPSILRPFILMVCCILSLSRLICVCVSVCRGCEASEWEAGRDQQSQDGAAAKTGWYTVVRGVCSGTLQISWKPPQLNATTHVEVH